jgi:hypothetical protein
MVRTNIVDTFLKLKEEAKEYELVGNMGKTKYLKSGRRKTNENKLEIETKEFE